MPEFRSLPRELVRTYFKYVFAFILTALSVELGNILDGGMVGQLVGPDAVAAVAKANDLSLVTNNTAHFSKVPGLKIENWISEGTKPKGS